jgi:putative membrane protein
VDATRAAQPELGSLAARSRRNDASHQNGESAMRHKMILIAMTAVFAVTAAWAADKKDQTFIKDAIEGNLAEVQIGKLAQDKGQSDPVKSFGQMLVTDHSDANQKATAVANQIGVTPPTEPNAKQKALYNKMSKLSGAAFDQQFAKEMVQDHKQDIQKYQQEAKKQNDPVGDYANQALPTLQKHLQQAQSLTNDKSTAR